APRLISEKLYSSPLQRLTRRWLSSTTGMWRTIGVPWEREVAPPRPGAPGLGLPEHRLDGPAAPGVPGTRHGPAGVRRHPLRLGSACAPRTARHVSMASQRP